MIQSCFFLAASASSAARIAFSSSLSSPFLALSCIAFRRLSRSDFARLERCVRYGDQIKIHWGWVDDIDTACGTTIYAVANSGGGTKDLAVDLGIQR